jgi:protein-tyrosine phosphatase
MIHYVRLPLEGTANTRDLGGYSTKDGHSTKWHVFLRSDDLYDLTEKDKSFLEDYGLSTIIDLRSTAELAYRPSPFEHHPKIAYHNVSLFENASPQVMEKLPTDALKHMYIEMILSHQAQVKEVLTLMANAKEGTILFNCAAGKDRTGVISMLLLGLAKVPNRDIVSNYEVSFTNLKRSIYFKQRKDNITHLMYSTNSYMEETLVYIREHYQSIEAYLLSIGLSEDILLKIKQRFISDHTL